ncbi:hypothetical protein ACEWY4_000264 [Coilia grayii]|uniref:TNFR-Cys domain-containing protein n=1 Tax=Coilia grayii TaxID=363190 RepID=A0ABD1KWQ9_9TELE
MWILILCGLGVCEACGRAEYKTGSECCPMCPPGHCVYRHCTEFTSTTCMPCLPMTFTDKPQGQVRCQPCSVCDTGTASLDTVCGDCTNNTYSDGTFTSCRPHTQCKPWGRPAGKSGTRTHDAECSDAPSSPLLIAGLSLGVLAGITLPLVLIYRQRTSYGVANGLCWTPGHKQKGRCKHTHDSGTVDGLSWKAVKTPHEEEC